MHILLHIMGVKRGVTGREKVIAQNFFVKCTRHVI